MAAGSLSSLHFIKGQPVDISPGHVYVVEFWATWCPPCKASIPHLTELQHKHKDVIFIGVTNEMENVSSRFVNQMGDKMDYRVATDPTGAVNSAYMERYNVKSIPSAFVVDKEGRIAWQGHPMQPDFENAIQAAENKPAPKPPTNLKSFSKEQLEQMKVGELRTILAEHHIQYGDCVEKIDLVNRILAHQ